MKNIIKKLFNSAKGSIDVAGVVVDVVLVVALIPIIVVFISQGRNIYACPTSPFTTLINTSLCQNATGTTIITAIRVGLSATEVTLLGLTTLFIVLALIFAVVKQSGLIKKM